MDLLSYPFMQRALVEAVIVGGVCALVGVYVVLNGLSFIGAGISHSAFGGVALGLTLGIEPTISALVFSFLVALSIGAISDEGQVKHDTAVGVFFAATMALGVLLISFLQGYYIDIFGYLFGNILAVTAGDLLLSSIMAAVIIAAIVLTYRELLAMSFDREHARVIGLPVRFLSFMLLGLISLTIVVSVKAVGVVLVSALVVTPAAAAQQLTTRFRTMLVLSVCFGIASSLGGLVLASAANIPSGATIVLIATVLFFLSWTFSPKRVRRTART
ncbi:MAG: metal ABC transporter permease [Ignavibacteria bacterium]|nr:metal ABC transporter permease [Ignavibacteria bacterium]